MGPIEAGTRLIVDLKGEGNNLSVGLFNQDRLDLSNVDEAIWERLDEENRARITDKLREAKP